MPVISYIKDTKDANSNKNNNNETEKNENNKKEENPKTVPTAFMVATPFFINNISQNYYLNKFVKKTTKPFAEREGDWICPECKNLNFAFRLYCNRCKHPKENSDKKSNTVEKTEENKNVKKEEVTKNTKKDLKGLKELKNIDVETIKVPIGQVKKSKNKYNRKHKKGHKSNANKEGENKKKE